MTSVGTQISKVELHLRKLIRYEGRVMTNAEMIHYCMRKGMTPDTRIEPCVAHTPQRKTRNKTVYFMHPKHDGVFVDISKTQYQYTLTEIFRDWCHNVMSAEVFAARYNTSIQQALKWVAEGRKIQNLWDTTSEETP